LIIREDGVLADPSLSVERFLLDHLPAELQDLRQRVTFELREKLDGP
jgi:hypothetical protein